MKNRFRVLFILMFLFITATTVAVIAEDPIGTFYDVEFEIIIGAYDEIEDEYYTTSVTSELGSKEYGSSVTIDEGTVFPTEKFATYIVNGKVEFELAELHPFLVTQELDVEAYYKPANTYMVAFMDANQDALPATINSELVYVQFVSNNGTSDAVAPITDVLNLVPIPGYEIDNTLPWDTQIGGSYTNVSQDSVLWVNYVIDTNPITTLIGPYTVSVTNGTPASAVYIYNELATVTASGTEGNFQHWQKDGMIVSINPSYTFTVLGDTDITAVYETADSPDPDGLFISLIPYAELLEGMTTYVGQFNLPTGHSMIEYGVITSPYSGGITLNTPNIEKLQNNKYNANTGEFVRHLDTFAYDTYTVRGYMITTDGIEETITYSQVSAISDITSVTITGDSSVLVTDTIDLDVSILPIDTTDNIRWISSDDNIATVDQDGIVTGINVGTATIYVVSSGNHDISDTLSVEVTGFTIFFEERGGSTVDDIINLNFYALLYPEDLPIPTKLDDTFLGWYTNEGLTEEVYILLITENITLYAKWETDLPE